MTRHTITDPCTLAEAVAQRCQDPHPEGDGWRARCPCHQGKSDTSLSVTPSTDRVLVHCFAECDTRDIVHAIGLTMEDLFVASPERNGQPRIVKIYDYFDAQGTLVHQTVRYEPKTFRQRRPDPAHPGQWIWRTKDIQTVLYNFPAVCAAIQAGDTIYLCEGEKDADALLAHGLVATTAPMGVGKWQPAYTTALAGAHVAILADHDEPGVKHATLVAQALCRHVKGLKLVTTLHTEGPGSDVSDWLAAGGTPEAFAAAIAAAPEWVPQPGAPDEQTTPVPSPPVGWPQPQGALPAVVAVANESWRGDLLTSKDGKPKQNVGNMALFLHHHPFWQREENAFWWDSVRGTPMMGRVEIDDDTITTIAQWLCTVEEMSVTQLSLLERCVLKECRLNKRDLLQIWLNTLPPWDKVPRLSTWLAQVTGVADRPYVQGISTILLLSMVARAVQPGCLYRYVVIFEGPEEAGKSTLVRALAGPEWYVELSIGLDSKESHMMLQGAWIAEMAELDSLSRTEETRLKAFITQRTDSYIPKFSNFRKSEPRRCIFIGTTNEESYLKGQSGNTRYMPLYIGKGIDVERFDAMREQLFAESLMVYQQNPRHWWKLPADVLEAAIEEREKRRLPNEYEQPLHDWLTMERFDTKYFDDAWVTDRFGNHTRVASTVPVVFTRGETSWPEIARWFLKIETPERWKDKGLQMQIAQALKALQWKSTLIWRNDRVAKIWQFQPGDDDHVVPF